MSATKKKLPVPLAQSPEYMRRYRLRHNPDTRARVAVKVKNYTNDDQAAQIERYVNKLIGWTEPVEV